MPIPVIPIGEPEEQRRSVIPLGGGGPPVDDFGPKYGWEWDYARRHPIAYPTLRTISDIMPFASHLWPTGRARFAEMSALGKTVDVGLDTLIFIPGAQIGKGIKIAAAPVIKPIARVTKAGKKYIPFRIRKFDDYSKAYLDEMAKTTDSFVYRSPFEQAIRKYKLGDGEARALLRGESSVWAPTTARSGFMVEQKTPALSKLFKKDGTLKEKVEKKIAKWRITPEQQRLNHAIAQYKKKLKPLVGDEADIKAVFSSQVSRLFGKRAEGLTMENIGGQDMSKVLMQLLINRGRVVNLELSSWHWIMPTRKVFGLFEPAYKLFSRVYKPAVKAYGKSNEAAVLSVEKFHKLLFQRGLVSLRGKKGAAVSRVTARGFKEVYRKGKWTEHYTKEHANVAGKALAEMDNMQGMGVAQSEINTFVEGLPGIPQRLVKAFQVWTDHMYAEFMKNKIPQLFRKAGLNERGRAAIRAEMDRPGKGLNRSISGIFSDEANLAYKTKAQYVDQILKDLRNIVEKNKTRWFERQFGI